MTPVPFTPTSNTNYVNSGYQGTKSCFKVGKICSVSISNFRFGLAAPVGTAIFGNLPEASQYVRFFAVTDNGTHLPLNTSGTTIVNTVVPATGVDYTLAFCYIAK